MPQVFPIIEITNESIVCADNMIDAILNDCIEMNNPV